MDDTHLAGSKESVLPNYGETISGIPPWLHYEWVRLWARFSWSSEQGQCKWPEYWESGRVQYAVHVPTRPIPCARFEDPLSTPLVFVAVSWILQLTASTRPRRRLLCLSTATSQAHLHTCHRTFLTFPGDMVKTHHNAGRHRNGTCASRAQSWVSSNKNSLHAHSADICGVSWAARLCV